MPNYGWRGRHPDTKNNAGEVVLGISKGLRTLTDADMANPSAEVESVSVTTKKASAKAHVKCTVPGCGKKYKLAALMAAHFRRDHQDVSSEKDAWREHVEKD